MRVHSWLLGAATIGMASVVFAQRAPTVRPPPAPTPPGVQLELRVDSPIVHEGETPSLTLRLVNGSTRTIRVSPPLDGSWVGWRDPLYTAEYLDASGAIVPGALGAQGGRCGNTNEFVAAQDVVSVAPGASVELEHHARAFGYDEQVRPSARPGTYQLRVRYDMSLPDATRLTLVSNTAPITIVGGNRATWDCLRDLAERSRNTTDTSASATRIVPWESGFALLYQLDVRTVAAGNDSHARALSVQRLDAGLHPVGAPVTVASNTASGDMVALDDALLVIAAHDESHGEHRTQSLESFVLRGAGNALAPQGSAQHIANVASAYHYRLVRQGEGAELFYFSPARGAPPFDPRANLSLSRFGRDGSFTGGTSTLAATATSGTIVWTATPRGQALAYEAGANAIDLLELDESGSARGPAQRLDAAVNGVPAGLHPRPGGYVLAFNRNVTTPEDRTAMGLYRQDIDDRGRRVGATTVLSTDAAGEPDWGTVVWHGTTAIRANQTRRDTHNALHVDGLDGRPVVLSSAYVGGVAATETASGFVVSWNDTRDDHGGPCQRSGDCESDAYGAVLEPNGSIRVGPTRLTSLLVSRATPANQWEEYCRASVHPH